MQVKAIVSTENKRSRAFLVAIVMLAIAFISATVLRSIFSSTDMYRGAYDKLNEKRNNVIALTTAATVTSYAITAVPDDAGTPIANQLMEIAKNFAFVLAAIVLEKHLLTVMGFVFFTVFVPISCVLVAISGFLSPGNANRQLCRQAAAKFFIFGLVLFLATPTSVLLSSMIDESYQASVDTMIAQGNEAHEQTNETANAASSSTNEKEKTANSNTPSNPIEFVQQQFSNVTSNVGSAVENAGKVVTSDVDIDPHHLTHHHVSSVQGVVWTAALGPGARGKDNRRTSAASSARNYSVEDCGADAGGVNHPVCTTISFWQTSVRPPLRVGSSRLQIRRRPPPPSGAGMVDQDGNWVPNVVNAGSREVLAKGV